MAFIPRIKLISYKELPFELHRVQFPVRLAFGMTISKSQGQSLGTVGLDLRNLVFRHRQFYVGVYEGDAADKATMIDQRQELIRDNVRLVQWISSVYNTLR